MRGAVPRRIFKQPVLKIMAAANKDAQRAGVKMVVAVAVGDSSKNTNHI